MILDSRRILRNKPEAPTLYGLEGSTKKKRKEKRKENISSLELTLSSARYIRNDHYIVWLMVFLAFGAYSRSRVRVSIGTRPRQGTHIRDRDHNDEK